MIDLNRLEFWKRQPGKSLLGLAFDGSRLDGAHVRRTNGSVEIKKAFIATLSLDPLTAETELAGREIRKQLDAEGIRERWCAVAIPLNWALTLTVKLPEIPDADVADFLQIEAERGFPYSPDELMLAHSRFTTADGAKFATLVGIPREHVTRLEAVLQAAQLRPVTFTLALTALQPAEADSGEGTLALLPGEHSIEMQITCGGGIAVLRTIGGAFEQVGAGHELQTGHIAREMRITLGQLPAEVREALKSVRVLGRSDAAGKLADALREPAEAWGLKLESARDHAATEFGVKLPKGTAISPALIVAVRLLADVEGMEFLPPKITQWQQLTQKYSSGKLFYAGAGAGAVALIVALAFFTQEMVYLHWKSKWSHMEKQVDELNAKRDEIRRYRPWFDESVRTLSILKRITEAFPATGSISAKTIELRAPSRVVCSGSALNRDALIKALDKLRKDNANVISDVHIETTRGDTPLEFTFNFQWNGPGSQ